MGLITSPALIQFAAFLSASSRQLHATTLRTQLIVRVIKVSLPHSDKNKPRLLLNLNAIPCYRCSIVSVIFISQHYECSLCLAPGHRVSSSCDQPPHSPHYLVFSFCIKKTTSFVIMTVGINTLLMSSPRPAFTQKLTNWNKCMLIILPPPAWFLFVWCRITEWDQPTVRESVYPGVSQLSSDCGSMVLTEPGQLINHLLPS